MHALELSDLALDLFGDRLGHSGLLDTCAVARGLLGELIPLAELHLDRLQLLPQVELALRPVDFAARLRVDLLLHGEQLDLLAQQFVHALEPVERIDALEHRLRVLDLELEVRCREIRQSPVIVDIYDDRHHLGRHGLSKRDRLLEIVSDVSRKRFDFERLGNGRVRDRFDGSLKVDVTRVVPRHANAADALDEDADPVVRQFQHPHDHRRGADRVEVAVLGLFDRGVALRREQDHPVVGQRLLDGGDRPVAAHKERHDHVREDDDVPERQNREVVRDLDRALAGGWFVGHARDSRTPMPCGPCCERACAVRS